MPLRIVPGSTIQSASVDRTKQYVDGRSIDNLRELGALTGAASDVADRVDGIIDNRPPNGQTAIDEIVRVEEPAHKATLFPEEKNALPALWKTLEWEDVPAASPPPTLTPLANAVRDLSVGPGSFDFNRPVAIADMPADLQKTAKRVQLVLNADNDPSTLNLADLEQAIAAPGRFTQTDVAQMNQLVEAVKAKLRGNGVLEAKASVPDPGVRDLPIPHQGAVHFTLHADTHIRETRAVSTGGNMVSTSGQITCRRESSIAIEVPAGKKALLINEATGEERIFEGQQSDAANALAPGKYRVELWNNGAREHSSEVDLPAHGNEAVDLSQFLDFKLATSDGVLHKNLVNGAQQQNRSYPYGTTFTATYEYSLAATPPDPSAVTNARQTDSPPSGLTPGRYTWASPHFGAITFDVYPENVMKVAVNGVEKTMRVVGNSGRYYDNGNNEQNPQQPRIMYDPTKKLLTAYSNAVRGANDSIVVADALRTG